jgi:hypothetical protein
MGYYDKKGRNRSTCINSSYLDDIESYLDDIEYAYEKGEEQIEKALCSFNKTNRSHKFKTKNKSIIK